MDLSELCSAEKHVDWRGRPVRPSKHGGIRAAVFIFVVEALENMSFIANATNLVTYFSLYMHYSNAESANILTNFMGTAFLLTLIGGFISDSFLSRFWTIVSFASAEFVGLLMLTLQAHFKRLKPPECNANVGNHKCEHPTVGQSAMLYIGLYMVALGVGAVKAALPAQGADQFDDADPTQRKLISNFFNWYFFSLCTGGLVAVTLVVWVQENLGWQWGFGLSTAGIALALLIFLSGFFTYRNKIPSGSPLTRIAKVVVAAIRNRKISVPIDSKTLQNLESGAPQATQLRFLDKAAIEHPSCWKSCTREEVEETKSILRVLPIFASTIMMNCCLAQLQTFSVQQGRTMNKKLGGSFQIPPPSLTAIPLVFMIALAPLYDQIFVPIARKITGIQTGITHLQRVGVGLVLSAIAMAVAAAVELKRKAVAQSHHMVDSPEPLPISVLWLGWQYLVLGIADLFTLAGLLEFFYSEAPSGVKSLSTALSWCSISLGYYLSSVLVSAVSKMSAEFGNGVGWLAGNNLNRCHLERFYLVLCVLTSINFFHYLAWAKWYKYTSSPSSF